MEPTNKVDDFFETVSSSPYEYQREYEVFMNLFKIAATHPEECGALIMRMAGYFARYNITYIQKLKAYNHIKAELMRTPDKETGKAMSGTKCDMLADDTQEACELAIAKGHLSNIEQYLNALKSLQKALSVEFGNQG